MADFNMTREEAIKALERAEDYAGIQCVNNCVDPYISPYLLKAIDFAVAALRQKGERRWIPATERLPESEGTYLVYTKRGSVYASHRGREPHEAMQRKSLCRMQ